MTARWGNVGGWAVAYLVVPMLASLVALRSVVGGGFQGDDVELLWRATAFDPAMPSLGYGPHHWRPLLDVSLKANHAISGWDPVGYRVTNLVLNGAVGSAVAMAFLSIVGALERRAVGREDQLAALVVATAFVVWPSHSEAVAWVSGRGDLLMTLFAMGALSAFAAGLEADRRTPGSGRGGLLRFGVAPVLMVFALSGKESVLAVPVVAAVIAWRHLSVASDERQRPSLALRAMLLASPLAGVTVLWFLVRRIVIGSFVGGFSDAASDVWGARVVVRYFAVLARVALPLPPSSMAVALLLASVLVAASSVAALVARRKGRTGSPARPAITSGDVPGANRTRVAAGTASTLAACAAVAALPVAPLGASFGSVAGERLAYLPSAFVLLAAGRLWGELLRRRAAAAWVLAAGIVVVAGLWTDDVASRWRAASDEFDAVVVALAALPRDEPAAVLGTRERTEDGIPVLLNALGASLVVFHGWTDPSRISDQPEGPKGFSSATVWELNGGELRRVGDVGD